ncbi:hypothetical protein ACS0TY_032693 [Phlomoides rotata]
MVPAISVVCEPKERSREAEREKMGLISSANEQAKKMLKKRGDEFDKPMIMGIAGMYFITLGLVDANMIPKYELTVEDGRRLAKEYKSTLLSLKKEAIEALPEGLKAAALVPDMTPLPINRYMATYTIEEKVIERAYKMLALDALVI